MSSTSFDWRLVHFSPEEFACKCGCKMPPAYDKNIHELVRRLEKLRRSLEMPVKVISGYRCLPHNKREGGSTASKHLTGEAADIQVHGRTGEFLAGYVEALRKLRIIPQGGGLGTYADKPRTLHYDIRPEVARWHT